MSAVSFEQTDATVTATASAILTENFDRDYLLIQNNGAETLYLNFSQTATTTNSVAIEAGKAYEPAAIPSNSISAVTASGSITIAIVEG